jgi:hypothetical protein
VERVARKSRSFAEARRWELEQYASMTADGRPPNRVDLISQLGSVPFSRAWRRRVDEQLEVARGRHCPIHFIGLADLLQSKRDAGRHKDLDDIEQLEALPSQQRKPRRRKRSRQRPAR